MFRKTVKARLLKKKPSLSSFLQKTLEIQSEDVKAAMRKFSYFKNWSEKKIHQCGIQGRVVYYDENDIVPGIDRKNVLITHFILEGSVSVIQRLVVLKYKLKRDKQIRYKLYKDQTASCKDNPKLETIFLEVCRLTVGACFGLGENLSDCIIKANDDLKCLILPKYIIFEDYTPDNIWRRIILFLDMNYPSLEELFNRFNQGRRWAEYKRNEFPNRLKEKIIVETVIHDVPLSIRMKDLLLASLLKSKTTSVLLKTIS